MGSSERSVASKIGVAALWVLVVLELLGLGLAGLSKFVQDGWANMFVDWGYARWFAFVIGAGELGGAVLLLIPRFTSYAASLLIVIMIGALWTVLTNETRLGPGLPTIHIVVLSILLAARWKRRWRPGGAATSSS